MTQFIMVIVPIRAVKKRVEDNKVSSSRNNNKIQWITLWLDAIEKKKKKRYLGSRESQ